MSEMMFFECSERNFYGKWRINKYETLETNEACSSSSNEITGTEVVFEESNEVTWKAASDVEVIPLFSCESYEVILTNPAQLTFVSSSVGRIGPFAAEFALPNELLLTYDKAFVLYLEKVPQAEQIQEEPFSFFPALEKGYFSDLVITSSSGKNFHIHRVILKLGCPEQTWTPAPTKKNTSSSRSYQACVLDGLSNVVTDTILHYIYCESLPPTLTESGARECVNAVSKIKGLGKLGKLCECYLENYAVRTKIVHLCDEVESSVKKINKFLDVRLSGASTSSSTIQSGPSALFHAMKQAIREFGVAILKVIQLFKLFADRRNELSREERHTIMKHCRSRLPSLIDLSVRFCEILSNHLSKLTAESRTETAAYFLAEVEPLFDTANQMVSDIRQALETIIDTDPGDKRRQKGSVISRTLRNAVHIKELAKLRRLHGEMVSFINNLMLKREHFALLSTEEKVEAVANIIECMADEIPSAIDRATSLNKNLEVRLSWTRWKYFFKMGAAKVSWIIEKLRHGKQSVTKAVHSVRKLVGRDDFDAELAALGLIDSVKECPSSQHKKKSSHPASNNMDSLATPPIPRDSLLSKRSEELYSTLSTSPEFTDVKFIVHFEKDNEPCKETINAHRVIVACRCDWFRRALHSGMREDIQREINVHDTNLDMFRHFLRYLYTGRLDCASMNLDTLAEMIALSDRYEVDALKSVCEGALKPQISNDNVLELLSIGEQFNAAALRECCMEYILEHVETLESDLFNELPPQLQIEIRDLAEWNQREQLKKYKPPPYHVRPPRLLFQNSSHAEQQAENNNELTSEMDRIDELTQALHQQHVNESDSDDEEEEERLLYEDVGSDQDPQPDLEPFLTQLREILGEEVSQDELVRIALAADLDLNRAVNFFLGSQG